MKTWQHISTIAANTLSAVCYPLLIPTYGMLLFCWSLTPLVGNSLPFSAWFVSAGTTFILTALIPVTAIMIRIRRGKISDIYITRPEQRTVPYLYTAVGFSFWCYFVICVLRAPLYIDLVAVGATLALFVVMLINFRWKISAHLTGMGGLIGGVMSHYLVGPGGPLWLPIVLLAVTLLLMYARLYVRAHNSMQVVAGFLLGLAMTLLPNLIMMYVV